MTDKKIVELLVNGYYAGRNDWDNKEHENHTKEGWINGLNFATSKIEEIIKLIERYWRFDDNQQPVSNWHDKQDLLEYIKREYLNDIKI